MKTLRLFTLILSMFAMGQSGLGADAKTDPNINQAKIALRARQYAEAVVALDKALGAKVKQADEALYLKGLALFYNKKYNACLKVCDGAKQSPVQKPLTLTFDLVGAPASSFEPWSAIPAMDTIVDVYSIRSLPPPTPPPRLLFTRLAL